MLHHGLRTDLLFLDLPPCAMGRHPSTNAPKATPKVKVKPEPVAKGKARKSKKTEDTIPVLPESVQAKYKEQWQQFAKVKPTKDCLLG